MLVLLFGVALAGDIPPCTSLDGGPAVAHERVGTFKDAAWLWLRAYQLFVSPADGASCTFYPSCSRYAMRAVTRDGPIVGAWMATERIQRNHHRDQYPPCLADGHLFRYDPPQNQEWWRRGHVDPVRRPR